MTKVTWLEKGTMKPLPPFKTLEEEATYWDSHSPVDEMDDKTVVYVHRAKKTD